ncbi:hypothetical protein B2J86_08085 [Acidovorax sp. SRB_14]|nr:hypothetical protein [Acidovorax sp. SRB_14]
MVRDTQLTCIEQPKQARFWVVAWCGADSGVSAQVRLEHRALENLKLAVPPRFCEEPADTGAWVDCCPAAGAFVKTRPFAQAGKRHYQTLSAHLLDMNGLGQWVEPNAHNPVTALVVVACLCQDALCCSKRLMQLSGLDLDGWEVMGRL